MFSSNWKRPSSLEYPKVWHRFEKINKDGKTIKFKIQDLTEEYHDNLFEMFMKDYIVNEPWSVNAKMPDYPESMENFLNFYKSNVIPSSVSLICLLDDVNQSEKNIIGFNFLGVSKKNEVPDFNDTKRMKCDEDLENFYVFFKEKCPDAYEKYQTDTNLGSMGLCVKTEYRGMGIATEILEARKLLCEALGIKITSTIFTGTASQKCAAKAGFQEDCVISYDEFRAFTGFEFKNCIDCKMMTFQIS